MKIKVSNYIAGKLVEAGINQVFTVTGGGAMHLNDALGHLTSRVQETSWNSTIFVVARHASSMT